MLTFILVVFMGTQKILSFALLLIGGPEEGRWIWFCQIILKLLAGREDHHLLHAVEFEQPLEHGAGQRVANGDVTDEVLEEDKPILTPTALYRVFAEVAEPVPQDRLMSADHLGDLFLTPFGVLLAHVEFVFDRHGQAMSRLNGQKSKFWGENK